MLLHTPAYLLFLLLVLAVYWLLPGRGRKLFLLAASYIFYAWFDIRFLGLLLGLTLVNHRVGWALPGSRRPRRLAWLSVALNLAVLAVFKWADFFIGSLQAAFLSLGLSAPGPGLSLLLPIGISFFTFQAIGYTVGIYQRKVAPAGLLDFALYLAFFPKLIAGPLARPAAFIAQLQAPVALPNRQAVQAAIWLLLLGLVKKIVIADSLATLGDAAFRAAARPAGGTAYPALLFWQGFYLYTFLIYADFSGYTDIARASAQLLGYGLPENFQQPYLSENITLFWNRWHMSLTQWFREHLFFPLSRTLLTRLGSHHARLIQILTTLITMLLIGIWHGASWIFIVWGLYHGMLLVLNQQVKLQLERPWQKLAGIAVTFHLVGFGWVIFRSDSMSSVLRFLAGMFNFSQPAGWDIFLPPVVLTACLVFGIDLAQSGAFRVPVRLQPLFFVAGVVVLICLLVLNQAHGMNARPFIYGQF